MSQPNPFDDPPSAPVAVMPNPFDDPPVPQGAVAPTNLTPEETPAPLNPEHAKQWAKASPMERLKMMWNQAPEANAYATPRTVSQLSGILPAAGATAAVVGTAMTGNEGAIPAARVGGAVAGDYLHQKIRNYLGFQDEIRPGELAASGIFAAPGTSTIGKGATALLAQAAKYGGAGILATTAQTALDAKRPPTIDEVKLAALYGLGGALLEKSLDTGAGHGGELAKQAENASKDAVRTNAIAEGYQFPPTAANTNIVNRLSGSVAGKIDTKAVVNLNNQAVTNNLGARALGVPELSVESIAAAKGQALQAHKAFAAQSPEAAAALKEYEQARYDEANAYFKYNSSSPGESLKKNPTRLAEAKVAAIEAAEAQQKLLSINPQLGQQVIAEKAQLAKIGAVEQNYDPVSHVLSAQGLRNMSDGGVPLTGDLKTIADIHKNFKEFMKDGNTVSVPGANKLTIPVAVGMANAGYHALGPTGLLAGAVPFMDKPVRGAILSRPYQQSFMNRPSYAMPNPSTAAYLARLSTQTPLAIDKDFLDQVSQ